MKASRAPRRLFALVLPIAAATAACAMVLSPSALAGDRATAQGANREATEIAARVVNADGAPVEGAVVVTSAGGRGVSGRDGGVLFTVAPDSSRADAHVTAVASVDGVNHVGSVKLDLAPHQVEADAGVIVLSAEGECEPAWLPTFDSATGVDGVVFDLAVFDDGSGAGPALYAGGTFTTAGGVTVNHIARWDGESWSPLGGGVTGWVFALAVFDDGSGAGPALYAGGEFTTAGGEIVNSIARWDGQSWSPVGGGVSGFSGVSALAVFDDGSGAGPALYAGGGFTIIGGVVVNHIAKWDGQNWSSLDGGVSGSISGSGGGGVGALTVFDDGSGAGPALYAGGSFFAAGGETVKGIAKWDGASWSGLGGGLNTSTGFFDHNPYIATLTVFDDGSGDGPALYAGGHFGDIDDEFVRHIAKWDGVSWSALDGGVDGGLPSAVHALTVFDDGDGPALYIGGSFTTAGGESANRLAKWDGELWSSLGSGMNSTVNALAVYDDGSGAAPSLYAGGGFTVSTAGDSFIARLQGCPVDASIPGDLNGDGVVNAQDLAILLGSWGLCPPEPDPCPADLNGDGSVGSADLAILLGNWGATGSD
ncbi:MAG: hypothetical protein EA376_07740 [Phycisphaeraceae bacterium]|nr:MAG: hypothetical protein EA376_07740 [Phycisphaeraceae bacterium]